MRYLAPLAILLAVAVGSSAQAFAQGFSVEKKSPPSLSGSETFTSVEGRFTVALPQRISEFSPISFNTPTGKVTVGDSYTWRLQDAQFEIGYMDAPSPIASVENLKAILRTGLDAIIASAIGKGGTLLGRSDISLAGNVGHEVRLELDGMLVVARAYAVSRRVYQLTANFKKDPQVQESALKALDSFRLLTPADVEAAMQKKIAEAMPGPLPQEPVAPKLKSDAEDEGLKGKVKVVADESEDLSGTWAVGKRKPTHTAYYNERGNVVRTVMYDWKGNPFDLVAYGYIDGDRASKLNTVQYEYNPPPVMISRPAGEPERKYDPRYSFKFKYKYDDKGRQVEVLRYGSDGRLVTRIVNNYKDGQKETLVYDGDGKLYNKELVTLDAKGNEVEESYFDVKTDAVRTKYSYAYDSFDAQGNWVKKTTSRWATKEGKSSFEPSHVTYRTITYY